MRTVTHATTPPKPCTAHRANGTTCKAFAIKGGTVCSMHGGRAPQVKRKAAERLAALIDPHLPVVAKRIVQGLYAMETKLFQKDGVVTDKRNLVNFSERRQAAELAMQALQIGRPKDAEIEVGVKTQVVINWAEKPEWLPVTPKVTEE